ncbi:hypothetical protein SPAR_29566 [Streptomyces sparsogenes DSM 40356]|uniref:Uncharacterized protein n=1 Tax=Streptomyces sparsogenes DSM 40356 TaxID=1331668 RepID=A0A1R1SBT4_9ACTN|nr:hypothetical protein SPAR_29566 [Streptomyces sparsogenes DSM 40356]
MSEPPSGGRSPTPVQLRADVFRRGGGQGLRDWTAMVTAGVGDGHRADARHSVIHRGADDGAPLDLAVAQVREPR